MNTKEFIIDCFTNGRMEGIRRLERLKSTIEIEDGREYIQDPQYSQIWITTTKSENELEDWLLETRFKYFTYVGIVERI